MKKKVYTGILLIAVVAIWGYVGYQFVEGMSPNEDELPLQEIAANNSIPIKINTGALLKLNYEDPFLKTQAPETKTIVYTNYKSKPANTKSNTINSEHNIAFNWPVITYKGLIQNQNRTDRVLGLVLIDGKEFIVRKGEKINNILITSIQKDKIEVSTEGQSKSISRI